MYIFIYAHIHTRIYIYIHKYIYKIHVYIYTCPINVWYLLVPLTYSPFPPTPIFHRDGAIDEFSFLLKARHQDFAQLKFYLAKHPSKGTLGRPARVMMGVLGVMVGFTLGKNPEFQKGQVF